MDEWWAFSGRRDSVVTRQRLLRLGTTVAFAFGLVTVAAYVLISGAINAQPQAVAYNGWIALLQHGVLVKRRCRLR